MPLSFRLPPARRSATRSGVDDRRRRIGADHDLRLHRRPLHHGAAPVRGRPAADRNAHAGEPAAAVPAADRPPAGARRLPVLRRRRNAHPLGLLRLPFRGGHRRRRSDHRVEPEPAPLPLRARRAPPRHRQFRAGRRGPGHRPGGEGHGARGPLRPDGARPPGGRAEPGLLELRPASARGPDRLCLHRRPLHERRSAVRDRRAADRHADHRGAAAPLPAPDRRDAGAGRVRLRRWGGNTHPRGLVSLPVRGGDRRRRQHHRVGDPPAPLPLQPGGSPALGRERRRGRPRSRASTRSAAEPPRPTPAGR